MTPSFLGSIKWLEQLLELRKLVYSLGYHFIVNIEGYESTAR